MRPRVVREESKVKLEILFLRVIKPQVSTTITLAADRL